MGKLKLDFEVNARRNPRLVVIANVINIKDEKKSKRNVAIRLHEAEYITVDPGQYVVEVILPWGQVISKDVTVDRRRKTKTVIVGPGFPSRWFAWQQFMGNMQGDTGSHTPKATVHEPARFQAFMGREDTRVNAYLVQGGMSSEGIFNAPDPMAKGFFWPYSDIMHVSEPMRPAWNVRLLRPRIRSEAYQTYSFRSASHLLEQRCFLFVDGPHIPTQYCSLPLPWLKKNGKPAVVNALVHRGKTFDDEIDTGFRLALIVEDQDFGALLGYLASGSMASANRVLANIAGGTKGGIDQTAQEYLYEKRRNPFAAAAAAYVLLAEGQHKAEPSADFYGRHQADSLWHEWIHNLAMWFPWLPDGAIQEAWMMLKTPRHAAAGVRHGITFRDALDSNEREEFRDCLLGSIARGLPFYSRGVRLLLDGLLLLADDSKSTERIDEKVERGLAISWQLASRINMRQPFTTVLLGNPRGVEKDGISNQDASGRTRRLYHH